MINGKIVLACSLAVDVILAQFKLDFSNVSNHLQSNALTSRSWGRATENEIHEKIK